MRNGRSVPLPADERSNKAADAEEAQSCRGLDDSCLSNIIVLHRWLVPARHNRLLHRSAAAPASLIHIHRDKQCFFCTDHVQCRSVMHVMQDAVRCPSELTRDRTRLSSRCSVQNIGELSRFSENFSCTAHWQLVSS